MSINGKTFLITGGAGFIGSNFVHYLYHTYPDSKIIVLDLLTYAGSVDNFPTRPKDKDDQFDFVYGDVCNNTLVDNLVAQADIIVHFAAQTHVTRSIFDNHEFFQTDVMGTQSVANAVLRHIDTVEKFIHISTSEVYGTAESEFMHEDDHPIKPASPYAAAKAGADRLVFSYYNTYDLPAVIIRPFNNYGPRQHLEKVIPRFITSCLLGEHLYVHGTGAATRDWIFVEDTCRGIDSVLRSDMDRLKGEVFNLGTAKSISIQQIAYTICELTGIDQCMIKLSPDRPGQVDRHTADIAKIKQATGWEPSVKFEEGLLKTIAWFKENESFWEKQIWLREVPIILKDGQKIIH